ncbi:O-antigen translocase [Flavobacterium psychrotrophum]|uniref:O-antigen translocase n=1 Tax=Flavobacterium psychrotrophum TaxID=2294119 RepID=UPI000E30C251|nr:O-antigen translocase [Flavobacterium psychrotrophum]
MGFNKFRYSRLLHVSGLNLINISVRVIGGIVSSKIVATFLGAQGMAITGSFRNVLTSLETFSMLGLQNGIIKTTAEFQNDEIRLKEVIVTSAALISMAVLISIVLLFCFSGEISSLVFNGNVEFYFMFRILAVFLPIYTASIFFISLLNGLGKYKNIILINIFSNIFGVIFSAFLIWQKGIDGAILGLILTPVLTFIFSVGPIIKSFKDSYSFSVTQFNIGLLKYFFSYSAMMFVTAFIAPVLFIFIRDFIMTYAGEEQAGYWDAINRFSSFYMMFPLTLINFYFLPELSKKSDNNSKAKLLLSYYKYIMPFFATGLILIFSLRVAIIKMLLSDGFMAMDGLFKWQLAGDLFKACGFILAQQFFVKRLTKDYIITEIISSLILFVLSFILIKQYGAEGATIAYAFENLILAIALFFYFRKDFYSSPHL